MSSQKNIYLTCKQFWSKYLSVNHFANASHTLLVLIKEKKKRVNGTTKNCRQGTPTPAAISWQKLPGAQNAQFLAFECNFKVAWHMRWTREITSGQQEPINTPKLEWLRLWSFNKFWTNNPLLQKMSLLYHLMDEWAEKSAYSTFKLVIFTKFCSPKA